MQSVKIAGFFAVLALALCVSGKPAKEEKKV